MNKLKIIVGEGSCGIAAGAGKVYDELQALLQPGENLSLGITGCIGMCRYEPIVEVMRPGEEKVTYVNVKPEMAARIVADHVVNGKPVVEYTISEAE